MSRPILPSVLLTLLLAAAPASAMPLGKVKLVSHATTGSLTGGPGGDGTSYADFGENFDQAISNDGRYVSLLSDAHNLQTAVTDDASSTRLFRADLFTGAIQMVDVNAAGTHNADGPVGQLDQGFPNAPAASADGRYVVWHSGAQDLVSGFVDGAATDATASDIYMRDMQTGTTSLLSRTTASAANGGNGDSAYPVMTPNGRFVLMYSKATDLVSGITDANNAYDIFLRDVQTGTTTLVSAGPSGTAAIANGGLDYYAMTPDGKYVVFTRNGNVSDVITGGLGSGYNVYRRNMDTGVTELLSPTSASASAGAGGVNADIPPVLSDDGRYVTFSSTALTLVPNDTNGQEDVFLRDASSHITTLVSHNAQGTDSATGGQSTYPRITPDGRFIVFSTLGTNLVVSPPDTAGADIYRFDRQSENNVLVSVSADGTSTAGNAGDNTFPLISDDGRYVAFESASTALVTGFVNNNAGLDDIFKRDMTAGTTSLVSGQAGSSTAGGTLTSTDPWMTPDGRFVSFESDAPEIVNPGTSSIGNVYVRGNFLPRGLSIATTPGASSLAFDFTGSASDPDGSISSFGWLFGDGASGTGATTSHTYAAAGSDTVTLTATDDDGESSQTTASVSPAAPPTVTTSAAGSVTATGATLAAQASNPDTQAGSLHFEYGTTTAYGTSTPNQALAAGLAATAFSAAVTGLAPGTTYHYRAVATNRAATVNGADQTFTTSTATRCTGTVRLAGKPKVASDGSKVSVDVRTPCAGRLKGVLSRLGSARAAAKKKPLRTLGTTTKTVTKAGKVRLTVRLSKAARALLKKKHKLRARLVVSFRPAAGGSSSKKTATVTLKAKRKKKG